MKKIVTVGAVVVGIIFLLFLGLVSYFYFVIFGNNDRTLARDLAISSEWTEITISPSVKPAYDHQAIYLRPTNYVVDRNAKGSDIRLPDGRIVKPEVEICDDSGKIFEMHQTGFTLGRQGADFVDFGDPYRLPAGRAYTRLRIRSEVPFVCEQIEWIDYSPP